MMYRRLFPEIAFLFTAEKFRESLSGVVSRSPSSHRVDESLFATEEFAVSLLAAEKFREALFAAEKFREALFAAEKFREALFAAEKF